MVGPECGEATEAEKAGAEIEIGAGIPVEGVGVGSESAEVGETRRGCAGEQVIVDEQADFDCDFGKGEDAQGLVEALPGVGSGWPGDGIDAWIIVRPEGVAKIEFLQPGQFGEDFPKLRILQGLE